MVKHLSTMQETRVQSLGWKYPLEKEMAIHSSTITWKIPWTEEEIGPSDCAHQTPGHLSCSNLGRAQNVGPTEFAPLRTTRVPEPERLRPGKCIQPRAGLRQFPAEQSRA